MSARIIHFGSDNLHRIWTFKNAGYTVEGCNSTTELQHLLVSGGPLDAVAVTEAEESSSENVLSMIRSASSVPVILFRRTTRDQMDPNFDLTVPISEASAKWLGNIARLIDGSRRSLSQPERHKLAQRSRLERYEEVSMVQRRLTRSNPHQADRLRRGALSLGVNQESLQAFRAGEFMKSLSSPMVQELESLVEFADCAPGVVLFAEGEPPQEVFLLLQGDVKLFIDASNGKRLAVHIAVAGEILGLASAFTGDPHRTTAVALHSAKVASVRREDFLNFVLNHPKACQAAAREMGRSFDQACTRLRTIGATSANRAKVARLLLEWSAKGKPTPRGIQIHVALKHGEIAECVGTVRESVTRILRDFKRWQIIEHRGSMLTILNPSALEKWANIK
jgi:CRP/FNR family transcriptional regulator, cyclic AMP receptor protein